MFFILSKTVTFFLQPSNLILLIGLAGALLLLLRWRRAGVGLLVASVVLLLVAGMTPAGSLLLHTLESRFPTWEQAGGKDPGKGPVTGIVVLGGSVMPGLSRQTGMPTVNADAGRVMAMARLARVYPDARIVYAGGDGSLLGNRRPETDAITALLDDLGIARGRVALESRSRNTAENAAFAKEIAQPKPGERWLLVTSAYHMPRSVGAFRAAGFDVEAYPAAYQIERSGRRVPDFTLSTNLARFDRATKEWLGMAAYWITGKTSALFPAP